MSTSTVPSPTFGYLFPSTSLAGITGVSSRWDVLKAFLAASDGAIVSRLRELSTGLLFISAFVRIGARAAFGYRRPAEVLLTAGSVRVRARTLILGRPVRERDIVLARAGLARAIREVRYPRAAFYAGLLCLALGSLLGVHTFVDGVRSASPSLLFYGLLVIAIGIGLDFLLAMLDRGRPGTCGVVFVTRDGSATAVRGVDATLAERALRQLAEAA